MIASRHRSRNAPSPQSPGGAKKAVRGLTLLRLAGARKAFKKEVARERLGNGGSDRHHCQKDHDCYHAVLRQHVARPQKFVQSEQLDNKEGREAD